MSFFEDSEGGQKWGIEDGRKSRPQENKKVG